MASYSSWISHLSVGRQFGRRGNSASLQSRRCTFKYFTKTGLFLVLVIILTSLPSRSYCRPAEHNSDYVYAQSSAEDYHSRGEDESSPPQGRFEFQRRISSSSDVSSNVKPDLGSKNVHSLDVVSDPLLNNSSMIVHVIVTSSSSSTSSSEIETDSESNEAPHQKEVEESFQYTIDEDRADDDDDLVDSGRVELNKSSSQTMSTTTQRSSAMTLEEQDFASNPPHSNSNQGELSSPPPQQTSFSEQYELRKLPKSQNENEEDDSPRDIFSAFYRAFTHPSLATTPQFSATQEKLTSFSTDEPEPITSFMIKPPARQNHNLNSPRPRRRFRNRGQETKRKTSPVFTKDDEAEVNSSKSLDSSKISVEEAEKKLEQLAQRLDNSDHLEDRVSSFAPSKVAVIVAVSHSKSVKAGARKKSPSPAGINDDDIYQESSRDEDAHPISSQRILESKENAKLGSSFFADDRIHGTLSPLLTRPRPVIKSSPRNDDDDNHDEYSNSHNIGHYFPRNLSKSGSSTLGGGIRKSAISNKISSARTHDFRLRDRSYISRRGDGDDRLHNFQSSSSLVQPKAEPSSLIEITTFRPSFFNLGPKRKMTRTVSGELGDPSSLFFNFNANTQTTTYPTTTTARSSSTTAKIVNWQQPEQIWSEPAKVWGEPAKVWGEPAKVWSEPAKVWSQTEKAWSKPETHILEEMMQGDQPALEEEVNKGNDDKTYPILRKTSNEDDPAPRGTFVILGDDENEGDSIDGDLGRPLMLHHFTVPPTTNNNNKPKETVITSSSISTSISSSTSTSSKNINTGVGSLRKVANFRESAQAHGTKPPTSHSTRVNNDGHNSSNSDNFKISGSDSGDSSSSNESASGADQQQQQKKSGKKFGYVIEGANVRKYRVEERTSDGYIVGEYGVLNNQNAFLRGVRYTADGTINPRLIHEALMKFLSLRRRK